jgi:hypothetical protein
MKTNTEVVEEFGVQFDLLGLKAPKGKSMQGLDRELLKDYFRKALQDKDTQAEEMMRSVVALANENKWHIASHRAIDEAKFLQGFKTIAQKYGIDLNIKK